MMNKKYLFAALLIFMPFILKSQSTEDLQRAFTELRFGAFVHFGIMTFTGDPWAKPNQDVTKFNPANLDAGQWADAFMSAKMKFAILTTKHHDGFCLWDSKFTKNDVASSPWKKGKGDVLKEFVDSMRSRNIFPCFYYSIWDTTQGMNKDSITAADMDFIKGQLTEILTGYGEIKLLFIDGWSWKMGHKQVPYDEIRSLVKKLQPGCLLADNTHLRALYHNDLIHYEDGSPYPVNNTYPGIFSLKINRNSGNDWFWKEDVPSAELLSADDIVNKNLKVLEPQWCNFILNCPPNRNGILDKNIIQRLKEAGAGWNPDTSRSPLPEQQPQIEYPVTPVAAYASSGNAAYAVDGLNDRYYYSVWESGRPLPQYITIDLGKVYNDVSILQYVPKYQVYIEPRIEGSIKKFRITGSTDGSSFAEIISGEWNGSAEMKTVTFPPVKLRYIKIEILTAAEGFAAATEFAAGTASSH